MSTTRSMQEEWMHNFISKMPEKVTLTIEGHSFKRNDLHYVGNGNEKCVWRIGETDQVLFVPRGRSEWEEIIDKEKKGLDFIRSLGLKTQVFDKVICEIQEEGKISYAIPLLRTQEFKRLAQKERCIIYNKKANPADIMIGPVNDYDFKMLTDKLRDKQFTQAMLEKLVEEFAIGVVFSLPIRGNQTLDDSEHLCFYLPESSDDAPMIRYMFWDIGLDYEKSTPFIPTLERLKQGQGYISRISIFIEMIASALLEIGYKGGNPRMDYTDEIAAMKIIEGNVMEALDDDFLRIALDKAKSIARKNLISELEQMNMEISERIFGSYLASAISIGDKKLIDTVLNLYSDSLNLSADFFTFKWTHELERFAYFDPESLGYARKCLVSKSTRQEEPRQINIKNFDFLPNSGSASSLKLFSPDHKERLFNQIEIQLNKIEQNGGYRNNNWKDATSRYPQKYAVLKALKEYLENEMSIQQLTEVVKANTKYDKGGIIRSNTGKLLDQALAYKNQNLIDSPNQKNEFSKYAKFIGHNLL